MALTAVDRHPAARDPCGQMPRHGYGHIGILVAVPQEYGRLDRRGIESPWPRDDPGLMHETADTLPEGFVCGQGPEVAHSRTGHGRPVSFRQTPIASRCIENLRRMPFHGPGVLRSQRPQAGWRVPRQPEDQSVDAVHARESIRGIDRPGTADAARGDYAVGQPVGHGQCIRAAAGESRDQESFKAKRVGKLADIARPVGQSPSWLERR
jgi:hypothetical protein